MWWVLGIVAAASGASPPLPARVISPTSQEGRGSLCWEGSGTGTLLYDSGCFDGVNGLSSERNTFIPLATTADDFVVPSGTAWEVSEVQVLVLEFRDRPRLVAGDVETYPVCEDGGGPDDAEVVDQQLDLPIEWTTVGVYDTEDDPVNQIRVFLKRPITLTPGRYFLAVRGVGTGPDDFQRAYWATTGDGAVRWDQGWFKSEFFGFPEWTPVQDVWSGGPSDFAFRLFGTIRTLPGDFDSDGDVDIADFSFFSTCFTGSGIPCEADCCDADLDADGDVDIADFAIFSTNFSGSQ